MSKIKITIFIIFTLTFVISFVVLIAMLGINDNGACEKRQANIINYIRPVKADCHSIENNERRFGALRDNGVRLHAGIDFVPRENGHGTPVYAVTSGTVTNYYYFFAGTDALVVLNDDGTVIRYGEISSDLRVGDRVAQGQQIAAIATMYSGAAMLHLEWYCGCEIGGLTQVDNMDNFTHVETRNHQRRADLLDPTAFFDLPLYASTDTAATKKLLIFKVGLITTLIIFIALLAVLSKYLIYPKFIKRYVDKRTAQAMSKKQKQQIERELEKLQREIKGNKSLIFKRNDCD